MLDTRGIYNCIVHPLLFELCKRNTEITFQIFANFLASKINLCKICAVMLQ